MTVSDVYSDTIDISRSNIYSFSVMNYHSNSCDLAKWKFLFYTSHVSVSIRILFTLQNHAMSDLTKNMDMLSLDIL